jgi:hypothetical protein
MNKKELKNLIRESLVEIKQQQMNEQLLMEFAIKDIVNKITQKVSKENIIKGLKWLKDGLGKEWKESKEMTHIWSKYVHGKPLSNWEKTAAKEQFKDVAKVGFWGVIGISPIPEPIEIPIILALAKVFNVNMIPSAFKDTIDYSQFDTSGGNPDAITSDKNNPQLEENFNLLKNLDSIDKNNDINIFEFAIFCSKAPKSKVNKLRKYVVYERNIDKAKNLVRETLKDKKLVGYSVILKEGRINESMTPWILTQSVIGLIFSLPFALSTIKNIFNVIIKQLKILISPIINKLLPLKKYFTGKSEDDIKKYIKDNADKLVEIINKLIQSCIDGLDKFLQWAVDNLTKLIMKIPKLNSIGEGKIKEILVILYWSVSIYFVSAAMENILAAVFHVDIHHLNSFLKILGIITIHSYVHKQVGETSQHFKFDDIHQHELEHMLHSKLGNTLNNVLSAAALMS